MNTRAANASLRAEREVFMRGQRHITKNMDDWQRMVRRAEADRDKLAAALGSYADAQSWMCDCERCVAVRGALAGLSESAHAEETTG